MMRSAILSPIPGIFCNCSFVAVLISSLPASSFDMAGEEAAVVRTGEDDEAVRAIDGVAVAVGDLAARRGACPTTAGCSDGFDLGAAVFAVDADAGFWF